MGVFGLCAFELASFTVGTGLHVGLAGREDPAAAAASIGRWLAISAVVVLCYFIYRMLPRRSSRSRLPQTTTVAASLRGARGLSASDAAAVFTLQIEPERDRPPSYKTVREGEEPPPDYSSDLVEKY